MTVYESLMFAVSFAGFMVTLITAIVSIVVILSKSKK